MDSIGDGLDGSAITGQQVVDTLAATVAGVAPIEEPAPEPDELDDN